MKSYKVIKGSVLSVCICEVHIYIALVHSKRHLTHLRHYVVKQKRTVESEKTAEQQVLIMISSQKCVPYGWKIRREFYLMKYPKAF